MKSRLAKLGYGQKDLARAAEVTESYISQLLGRRKAPPERDRTGIYSKMEAFLQLAPGELERLAGIDRSERLKRRLSRAPEPMFRRFRDLALRKCVPEKRDEVRTVFESQPFGMLERLVAQKVLEVVRRFARPELGVGGHFDVANESAVDVLDRFVESWTVDLEGLRIDIVLEGALVADPRRTFAFVESDPSDRSDEESALAEFLDDPHLNDRTTEDEVGLLRRHRFGERRPNKLYYYRAIQNLRDPLHFVEKSWP